MKHFLLISAALMALGACDRAKPRHLPPDPMAAPLPPPSKAISTQGLSRDLPRLPQAPVVGMGRAGAAVKPIENQPAVTASGQPVPVDGFGFDPVAKRPAKGVDIELDGVLYPTVYGADRPKVRARFKDEALGPVGFSVMLPALSPGAHVLVIRVVAADGAGYYASAPIPLTAP